MSSIYRRNDRASWVLQWRENGRYRTMSLETTDRAEAERLQEEFDARAVLGLNSARSGSASLVDSLARWHAGKRGMVTAGTLRVYGREVRTLIASPLPRDLTALTADDLADYVRWRDGASGATIGNELLLLRQVIGWLVDNGKLDRDPVRRWPVIKKRPARPDRLGAYSKNDVERLIVYGRSETDPRCHRWDDIVEMLAFTGARISEVLTIRAADCDFARGMLTLNSRKTTTTPRDALRTVEMHPRVRSLLLLKVDGRRPDELVFDDGRSIERREVSFAAFMVRACARLGIQYRRAHGFRHFWITTMLERGAPLAVVMAMCGHRNVGTTQRYLHVRDGATGWVGRL